jgi:hypothetical protein
VRKDDVASTQLLPGAYDSDCKRALRGVQRGAIGRWEAAAVRSVAPGAWDT